MMPQRLGISRIPSVAVKNRHCERSEAIPTCRGLPARDCFVAALLAMTALWINPHKLVLGFAVMNPAEVARRDQVVDVHVPQRRAVLRLVLAEQALELAEAGHLGAIEAATAGDLGKIAAPVRRVDRVDAVGAELVGFRAIAAVIDDADQHLEPVAL
jgi:hypothetical protein